MSNNHSASSGDFTCTCGDLKTDTAGSTRFPHINVCIYIIYDTIYYVHTALLKKIVGMKQHHFHLHPRLHCSRTCKNSVTAAIGILAVGAPAVLNDFSAENGVPIGAVLPVSFDGSKLLSANHHFEVISPHP